MHGCIVFVVAMVSIFNTDYFASYWLHWIRDTNSSRMNQQNTIKDSI